MVPLVLLKVKRTVKLRPSSLNLLLNWNSPLNWLFPVLLWLLLLCELTPMESITSDGRYPYSSSTLTMSVATYGSSLNVTDPLLELLWLRLIWKLGRNMMFSEESGFHSMRNSPLTLLLPLLLLERLLRNEAGWN